MGPTDEDGITCDKSCRQIEVPTEDEVNALRELRAIKDRVRDLKKMRAQLVSGSRERETEDLLALDREMEDLKSKWRHWDERRTQAARERMILLGHEEPS